MGRPPIPSELRRTERVTINLTTGEREGLQKAAGGESLSDFVRRLVLRFLARRRNE
jgi:hypothetical protein